MTWTTWFLLVGSVFVLLVVAACVAAELVAKAEREDERRP